jgi:hypothetical protein
VKGPPRNRRSLREHQLGRRGSDDLGPVGADEVEQIDRPNVRYFRTSQIVAEHADGDLDAAMPDGFHFSPHIHRMIGTELARRIIDWAGTQEHLKLR